MSERKTADVVDAFGLLFITLANQLQNSGALSVAEYRDHMLAVKDLWPVEQGSPAADLIEGVLGGLDAIADRPPGASYFKAIREQRAQRSADIRPIFGVVDGDKA